MESWEGAQLNQAKEILAFELTKLVHGEEEAAKAREASHALFAGGGDSGLFHKHFHKFLFTTFYNKSICAEGICIVSGLDIGYFLVCN